MGKTKALAGGDGHPIPASQSRFQVQTKTLAINLHGTGTHSEIF